MLKLGTRVTSARSASLSDLPHLGVFAFSPFSSTREKLIGFFSLRRHSGCSSEGGSGGAVLTRAAVHFRLLPMSISCLFPGWSDRWPATPIGHTGGGWNSDGARLSRPSLRHERSSFVTLDSSFTLFSLSAHVSDSDLSNHDWRVWWLG